jgi:hypothetical protein
MLRAQLSIVTYHDSGTTICRYLSPLCHYLNMGTIGTIGTIVIGVIAFIIIVAIVVFLVTLFAPVLIGLIILAIIIGVGYWIYRKVRNRT